MEALVRRTRWIALAIGIALAFGVTESSARADEPARPDRAEASPLAEQLFQEGFQLLGKGDYEAACTKLEASLKLDPRAVGTMLNIAICKEKTGKLASAWGLYREVAMRSRATRPDRYELADARQREIAPRVSTLTVVVDSPSKAPRDLLLKLDGIALDPAAWSSALPVDGGEHVVEASAPGRAPKRERVVVANEGAKVRVVVGPLAEAPPERVANPPPRAVEASNDDKSARVFGVIAASAGVVALGVGGVLGIDVLTRSGAPSAACPAPCVRGSSAADESQRRYDALKREAVAADVLVPAGAVLTLLGAYFWLRAPGATTSTSASLTRARSVSLGLGASGATLSSSF